MTTNELKRLVGYLISTCLMNSPTNRPYGLNFLFSCLTISMNFFLSMIRPARVKGESRKSITYCLRRFAAACLGCRLSCASVCPCKSFCCHYHHYRGHGSSNGGRDAAWKEPRRVRYWDPRGLEESHQGCRSEEQLAAISIDYIFLTWWVYLGWKKA